MYERIRALREDKDLTQREMGQILNVQPANLQQL